MKTDQEKVAVTVVEATICPQVHLHTPQPESYLQWFDWADKKSKTHNQKRCSGCGLYTIWVKKKKRIITTDQRKA